MQSDDPGQATEAGGPSRQRGDAPRWQHRTGRLWPVTRGTRGALRPPSSPANDFLGGATTTQKRSLRNRPGRRPGNAVPSVGAWPPSPKQHKHHPRPLRFATGWPGFTVGTGDSARLTRVP
ncbi:uncharacterized protein LOC116657487 isoform X2 [Camelus ferus]|uniref:Uncharacterized protein LOC116657487 isoform X2 n=1 Tax=Camelus ferus TaxID=419612 RepID=A0A8B8REL2_CAMFR|nr:uncharacterized protein LOC116657487 isoform X2 [Camelus ferus]